MNKMKHFVFTKIVKAVRGHGWFEPETIVTAKMPSYLSPSVVTVMYDMR
jgi:hypothetical protein